ncbi:hypothetical protein BKA62DRAFT_767708 [Auriculariales sp. MPI-PUGE-AT-0066]|nr:hypothetical protein BKA62DRAFT_767708 [Auriculariales sp. MPI-PUGE-AT-0066]
MSLTAPRPSRKGLFRTRRVIRSSQVVNASVPDALRALHDPPTMIKLNPLVIAHQQDDLDPSLWSITDHLNFMCIHTTTVFTAKFTLAEDGCITETRAAAGVYLQNRWRVSIGPSGKCEISEEVTLDTSIFLAGFVTKEIRKSHAELLAALATHLERRRRDTKDSALL